MRRAIFVNMIYGQKLWMCFTTALALASVSGNYNSPVALAPPFSFYTIIGVSARLTLVARLLFSILRPVAAHNQWASTITTYK